MQLQNAARGHLSFDGSGRGEHMQIGTFSERAITSEVSGNSIDLCPVGAFTNKAFY